MTIRDLQNKADWVRRDMVRVALKNHCGHIAPSLSCVDILVALYYEVANAEDTIIVSKGHGGYAQLCILHDRGVIPDAEWEEFQFPGCLERRVERGIHASTGSLGHGLGFGVGIAYARQLRERPGHVWVITGDGEMEEGSTYEAMALLRDLELTNMTHIVDWNGLRAMDKTLIGPPRGMEPPDGHNMRQIVTALKARGDTIVFETVKGYGIKQIEGVPEWHFRLPTNDEEMHWFESLVNSTATSDIT